MVKTWMDVASRMLRDDFTLAMSIDAACDVAGYAWVRSSQSMCWERIGRESRTVRRDVSETGGFGEAVDSPQTGVLRLRMLQVEAPALARVENLEVVVIASRLSKAGDMKKTEKES